MSIESAPTDKRILDLGECLIDVVASLIAHPQPSCVLLPAKSALRHPPEPPQLLGTFNPASGNPRLNPTLPQAAAQFLIVVGFVRVNLLRTMARSATLAAHERNDIYDRQKLLPIRDIGSRKHGRQRQAVLVYRLMALRSRTASVHRRRSNRRTCRPPFFAPFARMKIESTLARLQSIRWAASSFASSAS